MQMKYSFGFILVFLFSGIVEAIYSPKLLIEPAPLFDQECQARTGFAVAPEWTNELMDKKESFQKAWNERADKLNRWAEKFAGRKYTQKEFSVALVLCKWTPMAAPFIVSARPFLQSSASADPIIGAPLSMSAFVSITHHELLHRLVENAASETFFKTSSMLTRYQNEPFNVRVHLHLMAIQQATYIQLRDQDLLQQTAVLYNFIGGDYKRAWEIVNAEGYKKFILELQRFNELSK